MNLLERWRRWSRWRDVQARRIPIRFPPGAPWSLYELAIRAYAARRVAVRDRWRAVIEREGIPRRRAMRGGIDWPGCDAANGRALDVTTANLE